MEIKIYPLKTVVSTNYFGMPLLYLRNWPVTLNDILNLALGMPLQTGILCGINKMIILFTVILGLIVGSFLNVLILRLGTGRSIASGRSQCLSCNHKLAWHDLVPVFSFALSKGRCRYCGSRISFQYPIVELFTAILFGLLTAQQFAITYYLIASILIAILVYDLRHKIIPDQLVYIFIILSGLAGRHWLYGLYAFAFFALLWFVSRGKWMGFGDAKLALGMGFLLGISVVSALFVAFWAGAIVGICLLLLSSKKVTLKSEIPFAPFLIFGTFMSLFLNLN